MPMRIAAIDLGSNSFHLLVAEIRGPASFTTVLREDLMIQIGRAALLIGRLDAEAIDRGLRCLDTFRHMALARRVERTFAVATSAIREAENGAEFLKRARAKTGIGIRAISAREEARLIHLAVSRQTDFGGKRVLILDVGGGSAVLAVASKDKIHFTTSQKVGFLRLHGRFASRDPIGRQAQKSLTLFLRQTLSTPLERVRKYRPEIIVATGTSATALLRVARQRCPERGSPREAVHRDEIRSILDETLRIKAAARARVLDLEPAHATYFPTALLCMDAILENLGAEKLLISEVGLLEGLIYDFLARSRPAEPVSPETGDLRWRSVLEFAERYAYPADHSHRVSIMAGQIFRGTSHLHGLGEAELRLLEFAGILHDIGYYIGYPDHHKHGCYLIVNGSLRGFSPDERSVLAQIVLYHRRTRPKNRHPLFAELPSTLRKTVRCLSAILRIADGLDRSHRSLVDEVKCQTGKQTIRFLLVTRARGLEIGVDVDSAKLHARYFEKLFGVRASFAVARHV